MDTYKEQYNEADADSTASLSQHQPIHSNDYASSSMRAKWILGARKPS